MLNKETIDSIKDSIKDINKERDIAARLDKMIKAKDDVRAGVNDQLDELFGTINLKKFKINLEE